MDFPVPLMRATLLRRYNRFLADVTLEDGQTVTAHCPNPGAMLGLKDPGARIWVEPNDNPKRKLKHAWRLVELGEGHFAGIDTGVPNRVVGESLRAQAIPELAHYTGVRAEVPYGQKSRIDFLLSAPDQPLAYVEVKNVHLRRTGTLAEFPDCVTVRGAKHLRELSDMVAQGHRAVMLYLVQRTDCTALDFARDLDPAYGAAFDAARAAGVEVLCYDTAIDPSGVRLRAGLPVHAA